MRYEEIVEYIEEIPKFTSKNPLDHTKELMSRLGNPQNKMKVIHVAGTNGKGSVCAYLDSMLRSGEYRVGLFTSPHLVKINERFRINGQMISDDTFVEAFEEVQNIISHAQKDGLDHPSYFETLFLMCMVIFSKEKVDYAILETGLGGRLDATNTVERPLACVITSISLDHVEYLGDTVEKIAGEKAGIMKPSVPIIYDAHDIRSASVLAEHAKAIECPAYELKENMCEIIKNTSQGIDFAFHSQFCDTTNISIPYIAPYQMMNASLAFLTMEILKEDHKISMEKRIQAIKNTKWEGRMETILPGVIVDGAHNADGVARFVETASHFQKQYPITLLFSAVSDKDYPQMIQTICKSLKLESVITTSVGSYRAVDAEKLAALFLKEGCQQVSAQQDVGKAFLQAYQKKGEGMLFCVGSLYLIGEIKEYLAREWV